MILNLFSYPSNFGKVQMYKCDFYGNSLSMNRSCLIDNFTASVDQNNTEDQTLFGAFSQPDFFVINNGKINIEANFLFSNDTSGVIDPAIDFLFNVSAWAYQGTNTSYKFTSNPLNNPPVNEPLLYSALFNVPSLPNYKIYIVSETSSSLQNSFPSSVPSGSWIEVFKYGQQAGTPYPLYLEPMFRIDSSEGSFFPCMVDKISISMEEDYIKLNCQIVSMNFDRTTRFDFINSTQSALSSQKIIPLHKSRIKIKDFTNDITTTFRISDLSDLRYMAGLITQSFEATPVSELTINIDNKLQPVFRNVYGDIKRAYVGGYYSKERSISGTMSVLALRSSQPTFDKYPVLNSQNTKSLNITFGNQMLLIPYTIWQPGKLVAKTMFHYNLIGKQ